MEFTEVATTVNALRRVAEGVVEAEPPPGAWAGVLAEARRVEARRRKRRLRWPRLGPAVAGSLAAVAILVVSVGIRGPVDEPPDALDVYSPTRLEFSSALGDPVLLRGGPAVPRDVSRPSVAFAVTARWLPPDGSGIDEVAPTEPVAIVTRPVQRL